MADDVLNRLEAVRERIETAVERAGRSPEDIQLVAVSKRKPLADVEAAISVGHLIFGENYVQEAEEKICALRLRPDGSDLTFHMIGNLQRNKAKRAVGLFDVIQTIDRLELAEEVGKVASNRGIVQSVLLQVNISREDAKSGVLPEDALELCQQVLEIDGVAPEGLMMIGHFLPAGAEEQLRRNEFVQLRKLREDLEHECGVQLPQLSMGMTDDFEWAIEEGATIVRVGTAIFGERT